MNQGTETPEAPAQQRQTVHGEMDLADLGNVLEAVEHARKAGAFGDMDAGEEYAIIGSMLRLKKTFDTALAATDAENAQNAPESASEEQKAPDTAE